MLPARRCALEDRRPAIVIVEGGARSAPRFAITGVMSIIDSVITSSPVAVHEGRFVIARCDTPPPGTHFALTTDRNETTVVAAESEAGGLKARERREGYRLIEIRVSVAFEAVGFLARLTTAVAAAGVDVYVVSTWSCDYLLVAEPDLPAAVTALRGLGMPLEESARACL
jgi:hypothetical protein